jgi:hypothetical protein
VSGIAQECVVSRSACLISGPVRILSAYGRVAFRAGLSCVTKGEGTALFIASCNGFPVMIVELPARQRQEAKPNSSAERKSIAKSPLGRIVPLFGGLFANV